MQKKLLLLRKIFLLFIGIIGICIVSACTLYLSDIDENKADKKSQLSIATWNVQTFFDAETVGTEFNDFKGSKSKWNTERYTDRLQRLCAVMKALDKDVFVFQEVENTAIMQDIMNNFAGYNRRWKHTCFAIDNGGVFGIAIFSRYPIDSVRVHQINVKKTLAKNTMVSPHLRPLVEARLLFNDKPLYLFACHWKSKASGKDKGKKWRRAQEMLLAERLLELNPPYFVICGDFNRNLYEFERIERDDTSLINLRGNTKGVECTDFWTMFLENNSQTNTPTGSYYYQKSWEKIDHFLYAPQLNVSNCIVEYLGEHAYDNGIPRRYNIYSGKGFSDHLPLSCSIRF